MTRSPDQTVAQLMRLGFVAAAEYLGSTSALMAKLAVAYRHYRFVIPSHIETFNQRLAEASRTTTGGAWGGGSYEHLTFTALANYPSVPPPEVLEALEAAMGHACFDAFEIAQIIEQSVPKPDPILFGCVTGCEDRFYVAQWQDDVNIEDLLEADEGYVKDGQDG